MAEFDKLIEDYLRDGKSFCASLQDEAFHTHTELCLTTDPLNDPDSDPPTTEVMEGSNANT